MRLTPPGRLGPLALALVLLPWLATPAAALCGDGVHDAGEACDASAAGGDAACPGRCIPAAILGGCSCAAVSSDARQYVVLAETRARLGTDGQVIIGHVGVRQPGGFLTIGRRLVASSVVQTSADHVRALGESQLGRLFANDATLAITATVAGGGPFAFPTPLDLGTTLPPATTGVPGTAGFDVPAGTQAGLAPGAYGLVRVGLGATLVLRGVTPGLGAGVYNLEALRVAADARLLAENPVVVHVADRIGLAARAVVGPVPNAPVLAGDIEIDAGSVARASANTTVEAHLSAPAGSVRIGRGAFVVGRLIGREVSTAKNVMLIAEGGCGDGTRQSGEQCDASAAGGDAACPGQCVPGDPAGLGRVVQGQRGQCTCRCTADTDCDDGNVCNGLESCQAGICALGTPLQCGDGNACTRDCDPAAGCVNVPHPDGTSCSDGNPCTRDDLCAAGVCTAGPARADGTSCSDGNACTDADRCAAGSCIGGSVRSCGDGNPCTDDTCDPELGCGHATVPDGAGCSDANACTVGETCQAGSCVGGTPPACNDGNPCTADLCDTAAGCQHPPLANGTPCGGGATCTGGICS